MEEMWTLYRLHLSSFDCHASHKQNLKNASFPKNVFDCYHCCGLEMVNSRYILVLAMSVAVFEGVISIQILNAVSSATLCPTVCNEM